MRRLEWILTFLLLAVVILVLLAYMEGCNMAAGFPDWTRAVRLLGIDADGNLVTLRTDADGMLVIPIQGEDPEGNLTPVLVDASGQLIMVPRGTSGYYMSVNAQGYLTAVITGINPGGGSTGVAVDASGQIIMVPRGESGHYMSVDASGNLTTVMKGLEGANLRTLVVDGAGNLVAVMKGLEGANLRTIAVDASGQLIMVPRGSTGNYMAVDASGNLTTVMKGIEGANLRTLVVDASGNLVAVMKGLEGANLRTIAVDASGRIIMVPYGTVTVEGTATVTQDDSVREIQGAEGANLHTIAVDASGQMIMVPRGSTGNYMAVDASGNLTTVMKGIEGANLRTLVVDASGNLVAVMKGLEGANLRTIAVDSDGQIIMVPRGSTGNYMAIDSNGYMTAVLKGIHDSTLTTIALDASGRIYGYQVDDLDQWGETLLVGNAEQAARLGSPVSWDRRGQVQAVFNFEQGLHGVRQVTAGTGAAIELSPEHWQSGGYSVKLTGGSDSNLWAYIGAYMATPPSDVWGCAIHWSAEATPDYLEMRLEGVVENTFYSGRIRYDFANTKLQYRNTSAVWTDIGTKDLEIANYIWHRMKVVIDVDNEVFVRALLNNTQYDMSAAITTSSVPTVGDYARCEVYVISGSGDNDIVYLDTLIFTVKEPT